MLCLALSSALWHGRPKLAAGRSFMRWIQHTPHLGDASECCAEVSAVRSGVTIHAVAARESLMVGLRNVEIV